MVVLTEDASVHDRIVYLYKYSIAFIKFGPRKFAYGPSSFSHDATIEV